MSTNDNKRIVQLSKDVVDKIAAGEVIVRPMNAVKELLENSLDAGATEISISIGGGGMELIKIQDNGHGIDKEDLPIACNRFATSKLQKFEDLRQICTYGFRGEALASISHVANLTIITRRAADKCAHKATFKDGQIVGQISQCAGLRGTIICVEKLFHNAPHRLASISRQATEEANRIADLIVRYAIHYPNVAFGYRRLDGGGFDFRSPGNGDQHGTIRTLMHEKATKELVNIEFADSSLHFTAKACLCTPAAVFTSKAVQSRHDKFKVFHLFINGRCVDSPRLQRAFDAVFVSKDALCPFVSFSLQIEPQRVDVNVHPTKAIVHFLEEDRIIERIEREMHQFLTDYRTRDTIPSMPFVDFVELNRQNNQRQSSATAENDRLNRKRAAAQIPSSPKSIERTASANSLAASNSTPKQPKVAAKDKIRVDFSNRSLDEFLLSRDDLDNPLRPTTQVRIRPLDFEENEEEGESMENPINLDDEEGEEEEGERQSKSQATMRCIPRDFDFDSLVELRREICRNVDQELMEMFKRHILIGFFDTRYSLIQSGSSVFLLRNDQILRKFFYQLLIFSFGNMGAFDLVPQQNAQKTIDGLSIRELLLLDEGIDEEEADRIGQSLLENRKMLWDFFSIKILPAKTDSAADPLLASIPCLIDGFMPELEGLPHLLLQLGQVNFEEEQQSFFGIASALAEFHIPFMMDEEEENEESRREIEQRIDEEEERKMQRRRAQRALRAVIFPALRNRFLPSEDLREYCQQLTSTGQAFKHFGRC